jgi:hypothetical protein
MGNVFGKHLHICCGLTQTQTKEIDFQNLPYLDSLIFIVCSISYRLCKMDNTNTKSTQDAALSDAVTARRLLIFQQRELRRQQLHAQQQQGYNQIPIVLRRRATGPRMNPQDMVRLLNQALAISSALVSDSTVDSMTPKNSTHQERDRTEEN